MRTSLVARFRCGVSPYSSAVEGVRATSVRLVTKIVVVHSRKGGVGKSTLSYELAWLLEAPLVDLDWEAGGVTRTWGYRPGDHLRRPLLDAFASGRTPRPLAGRASRRPDLVPNHPDFELEQPDADDMADALKSWAGEWGSGYVVVDTHPGASTATNGALQIADAVVVPVPLSMKEIVGTEATVQELAGFPLILVPNKVPRVPPPMMMRELEKVVEGTDAHVAPPVPAASAVATRRRRIAMAAEEPAPKAIAGVVSQIERVSTYIKKALG